jgi:hypothetical protein
MDLEKNRKKLFSVYKSNLDSIPEENRLGDSNGNDYNIDDFLSIFDSSDRTKKLYTYLSKYIDLIDSDGNYATYKYFVTNYACDKDWAKNLDYCKSPDNQQDGNQQGGNQQGGSRYVSPWKPINFTVEDIKKGVKTLEKLMKGDVVSKIQEELIKHGFTNVSKTGKPDNFFGRRTEQSVKDFQKKMGIPETGIVNDLTMINLEKPKDSTPSKTVPTKNTTGIRGEKKIINVEDL